MSCLPLQKGILYGPIDSRRLGKSLGINLMPTGYKLCSFNCVYCHYGWTEVHALDAAPFIKDMPSHDDVVDAVESALKSRLEFDYLTFSGNGEPTLYPQFATLVERISRSRDRCRPGLKIALLSNSSGLGLPEVKSSIKYIDIPVFKLDAGNEDVFKSINRPFPGVSLDGITANLRSLSGIMIQTVLVTGDPGNVGDEDLNEYFVRISDIKPQYVHIYSIDRPVPNTSIARVLPDELERIAELGGSRTGVPFKAFFIKQQYGHGA
ncbi:MAG: radical SAM protein [candidate division WOR-3 bacterium]|nr:MAG: radical SAM protein [candidate division WOR-3 bacterium]